MKLTENETIDYLRIHLTNEGWKINNADICFGQKQGIDLKATKDGKTMLVEVKGAVADSKSPTSKNKDKFDSGQIKTHFGMAIVKMLVEKNKDSKNILAIAHPDDEDIRRVIGNLIPYLKNLSIRHYWVSETKLNLEV